MPEDYGPGGQLDITPAGRLLFEEVKALRTDFKDLAKELRTVTEALIAIRAQDVATELAKLKEKDLAGINQRLKAIEDFQLRAVTIFAVIQTLVFGVLALLQVYAAFKK